MIRACTLFLIACLAALQCLQKNDAHAQHAGDILIGMSSDHQLIVTELPLGPLTLPPVSSGALFGWASNTLGFDGVFTTSPELDLHPVSAGADVYLEVVSIDEGLSFRSFAAFTSVFADAPGERLRIGGTGSLHWHPIVFVDGAVVGSDYWGVKTAEVKLVDLGPAGHEESLPFELAFSVVRPATGDFNADGVVDGNDFLLWQRSFGEFSDQSNADGNFDGVVDGADLAIWKRQYGSSSSGSAQRFGVPEPNGAALTIIVGLALAIIRSRSDVLSI